MSLIHLAILAKAIEEQQRKTGARHSTKTNNSNSNNTYDYHDDTVSTETFLEDLLATDPEATKLFLLLKDCQKQINDEDHQKSLEEVQRIAQEYDEQAYKLHIEEMNLGSHGITLDNSSIVTEYYCSVKVEEGQGFGGYGSYSYNPARYRMGFNGMPLTREMIKNNINQFQIDLEIFNKENPNLDEQLKEIQTKISKQKKSIKYSPFNKPKKQSILTDMLKLEKEIKEKITQRTTLEKQSTAFEALTKDEKKAILDYMDQVANCIVVGEQLSKAINFSIAIGKDFYNNKSDEERNVHQRMLERTVETSEFTIEEIDTILAKIKEIMDKNEVSYNRYTRLSDKEYSVYPTSPESMFATEYFKKFYQDKTKSKK